MQQRDMEELMRRISRETGNPDAAQAAGRMRDALNTPEGRRAAQKILEGHSSSLENAARMAQAGNLEGAKQSVQELLRTPDGARLAAQIAKLMGR